MTDSVERVVVNFGDVGLSDVCLVVGNTDFNVHKIVLANRSSHFKTLFFGDFKEKHEKRITMEANPVQFHWMLEIVYEGRCDNKDFFKCNENFPEVFWKEGVPLWELLDRYDVQIGQKYFEKHLNINCCPQGTRLSYSVPEAQGYASPINQNMVSICSNCALRKIFAMQNGIKLNVSAFDSESIKTAFKIAREKQMIIDSEVMAELLLSVMHNGVR